MLRGRHEARYFRCLGCQSLQIPDPHWLPEAYAREEQPPDADDRDTGRFRRNYSAFLYTRALMESAVLPFSPELLDYGGGYGLLTQMFADAGFSASTADAYVPRPFFAPDHVVEDLAAVAEGRYDVVLALEVFEHLTNPLDVADQLRRVLRDGGTMIISTEVFRPDVHGPDWGYLAQQGGQHITFWSQEALRRLAVHMGLRSVGFYPGADGFLIVMSPLDPQRLSEGLRSAAGLLDEPRFLARSVQRWDFRNVGVVAAQERPIVVAGSAEPPTRVRRLLGKLRQRSR